MSSFIQHPLILLAAAACLGSYAGCRISPEFPRAVLTLALLVLPGGFFFRKKRMGIWILLLGVFLVFWARAGITLHWESTIDAFGPRRDICISGVLKGFPVYDARQGRWKGVIRCSQATYKNQNYPVAGKIQFAASANRQRFYPEQPVMLKGSLTRVDPPMNPGEFDYKSFLHRQGITMRITGHLESRESSRFSPIRMLWRFVGTLRYALEDGIRESVPQKAVPFILAVTTGNRSGYDTWKREMLTVSGLAHLIAISGLHVGIVYVTVLFIVSFAGGKRSAGLLIGLSVVAMLVLITGIKVPILRSFVMLAGVTTASFFFKKGSMASGIAFAVLVLLISYPCAAYDAGFQLSVIATISICCSLLKSCEKPPRKSFVSKYILGSLRVSGVTLLGTLPIVLFHFYQLTPWAIFSNLLAVPLIGVTVIFGFLSGVFSSLPLIGKSIGFIASLGVVGLEAIAKGVNYLPWSRVFCPRMPLSWIFGYYFLFFSYFYIENRKLNEEKEDRFYKYIKMMLCIAAIAWGALIHGLPPPMEESFKVTFLSLAIGESTLIETRSGKKILIDLGTEPDFFWRIKPVLAHKGINHLDAVILSHADSDHAGGLKACLTFFKVHTLIYGGGRFTKNNDNQAIEAIEAMIDWKKSRVIQMQRGDTIRLHPRIILKGLWPPRGMTAQNNAQSLAILLKCEGIGMLFTGDAPAWVQRQLVIGEPVQVYKVSHHGDAQANDVGLLTRLQPIFSVVMPGNKNPFGFPDDHLMQTLRLCSQQVLDTRAQGAVEVIFMQDGSHAWRAGRWEHDKLQPIAGGEEI